MLQDFYFEFTLAFFNGQSVKKIITRTSTNSLFGVSEWREKFSPSSANSTQLSSTSTSTLPLLLLPFTPSQIILPGQCTTLTFRHGKYMDMIDDALTSYESVVGLSVLDEDGLLPVVVVCEVLEEELTLHSGFRGVVSMEVGLRAVGRACRCDGAKGGDAGDADGARSVETNFARTALDDIHLGNFVDWQDDTMDIDELKTANEYVQNIESSLMLPSSSSSSRSSVLSPHSNSALNNETTHRLQRQELLYNHAYESALQYLTTNSPSPETSGAYQYQQHARLIAASWAIFAAIENESKSASAIMQALSTTDTVERLRLGTVVMLENMGEGTKGTFRYETANDEGDDAFQ